MAEKKKGTHISFDSVRRFGIELEVNSFDGLNRPARGDKVNGIDYVSQLVASAVPEVGCQVRGYEHTEKNDSWVCKPDSSCGMEIVSPAIKGWKGLKDALSIVEKLAKDTKITADRRCSVHVHTEIADLDESQLASVVAWWVKCEPVIMDAMPLERKRNRYCQFIGLNNVFQHDGVYSDRDIISRLGETKYSSMNTNMYCKSNRKTIEFRTIEGAGVKDAYLLKNWVRFLLHFVEITATMGRPKPYYEPKDEHEKLEITPWTSMLWLDPTQVLTLLGLIDIPTAIPGHRPAQQYTLSKGMTQTRNWFLARLQQNMSRHKDGGLRSHAYRDLQVVLDRLAANGQAISPEKHLSRTEQDELYGNDYIF